MTPRMKKKITAVLAAAGATLLLAPGAAHATEKEGGYKRCGKGQEVIIVSKAVGHIVHKFKKPGKRHHVWTQDFGHKNYLLTERPTPTGLRSVKYRIYALDVPGKFDGAKVETFKLLCRKF
ncbi:hypothetical protein [Streptomyces hygroscopicus]|uniref:hypothetical protein n=1 Tax=Streptomyces hygroscopicus TaxID=1912 RepID=UPI001FCC85E9|nr:hypothetical protein [Streptomyces hygroscopicus]BDH11274.1 hypothetical protein HOK021_24530 [Streptomyces hygroscopicus]